jgi:hypothetical protein
MNIKTVQLQQGGYLLNGTLSVPNNQGNRHYQQIQEWIAEGNTPELKATKSLAEEKIDAVKSVEEYAEGMRSAFTSNAAKGLLATYQLNSDVLNLLDSGVAYSDIDEQLRAKIDIEVATDKRYKTAEEIMVVWRIKRGKLAIASAWIAATESNTIASVNLATNKAEIDQVIAEAKSTAKSKYNDLTT